MIVGRLLAGEVVTPGSYHRRTLRVIKDLDTKDILTFNCLCRFVWNIAGSFMPVVFELENTIYRDQGVDYSGLVHLDDAALISFMSVSGIARVNLPPRVVVGYAGRLVSVEPKAGSNKLSVGNMNFTEAGQELCTLLKSPMVPGLVEYVAQKWRGDGQIVEVASSNAPPTA